MNEYTDMDSEKIKDLFCNETGYQTPKVDIRGAVIVDNKILLVRESTDGLWSIPGGWAEFNLSIKENVVKELLEEAGVNVVPKRLIAVLDRKKHHRPLSPYGIYKIFVLCDLVDGTFKKNIETTESGFLLSTICRHCQSIELQKSKLQCALKPVRTKALQPYSIK